MYAIPPETELVESDIKYLTFYIMEKDPISGSLSYYDLSGASSIVLRLRKYNETSNALEVTMVVTNPTLGLCRVLATIPPAGRYESEIEVYEAEEHNTWKGPVLKVRSQLG